MGDPVVPDPPFLAAVKPYVVAIRNAAGYTLGFAMIVAMVVHWYVTNQGPPAEFVPLAGLLVGANIIAPAFAPIVDKVAKVVGAIKGKSGP